MGAEANNPDNNLDAVFHVLHASSGFDLPTQMDMEAWVTAHGLGNPSLASKDEAATLQALQARECVYLVDTSDMTVTWKECSCMGQMCTPSIVEGLSQLDAALQ